MHAAVTLRDIAARCGVSNATVSRALRDPSSQNAETSRRIMETAQAMGYDQEVHHAARRMSLRKYGKEDINHLIGLVFPQHYYQAPYFNEIFEGLLSVLTPKGYGILLIDGNAIPTAPLPPCFSRGEVDGVIVYDQSTRFRPTYERLRNMRSFGQRPILSMIEEFDGCSSVLVDKSGGAYAVANHLLDLGHQHLLYVCGMDRVHHDTRPQVALYESYVQACRDRGWNPDEHLFPGEIGMRFWMMAFDPRYSHKLGMLDALPMSADNPLLRTLRQHPEITAILAPNDGAALVVHRLLTRNGIRVPDDISLVGFDDTNSIFDEKWQNILTTVRVPLQQVGRTSARLMIERITGERKHDAMRVLPTKLLIRASTCAPASRVEPGK
jgi:DNA-binding LacI/PurR family transcriptional regulator